ncbi:putative F-box protein At1g67623 [Coffea eugenioides]|uniref:putative F-box protein At1g67623 n=1 Tax=Coffea eugenioides TaxID=49369 RepID=UPI000F609DEC|nr:putative F-box protein At1g67623 [Coffea eugenioides]XP_027155811.1 putative F-box protein At1g67623 [Coffea eugenioides]XP_027157592.1 putative F-box protein At1g67623 [Coffea eugenioides]XP_027164843.1 putative F-box protein At1g67623 [Coffea eugenioides]XP_027166462.1 putative F-box protein At1g67623 [Coffea eugenioides]XP_027182209.1 putative F-box protein At1g67623 [Coffea eugenioides]
MANQQGKSTTSILSLPTEVVSEVLARVGSSSSTDLFSAKLCCKLFNEASAADTIYQRVSLEKFEIVPWHKNDKVSRFLKKCRQCQNPEAMYRKAVVDYFSDKHLDAALECLEEAADSGHPDAAYALGIIYLFVGTDEFKRRGMGLLSGLQKSRFLQGAWKLCRENLRALVRMIWVKNPVFLNPAPICCAMTHERKTSSWPMDADDVEEITCEGCACDEEIAAICAALPNR